MKNIETYIDQLADNLNLIYIAQLMQVDAEKLNKSTGDNKTYDMLFTLANCVKIDNTLLKELYYSFESSNKKTKVTYKYLKPIKNEVLKKYEEIFAVTILTLLLDYKFKNQNAGIKKREKALPLNRITENFYPRFVDNHIRKTDSNFDKLNGLSKVLMIYIIDILQTNQKDLTKTLDSDNRIFLNYPQIIKMLGLSKSGKTYKLLNESFEQLQKTIIKVFYKINNKDYSLSKPFISAIITDETNNKIESIQLDFDNVIKPLAKDLKVYTNIKQANKYAILTKVTKNEVSFGLANFLLSSYKQEKEVNTSFSILYEKLNINHNSRIAKTRHKSQIIKTLEVLKNNNLVNDFNLNNDKILIKFN